MNRIELTGEASKPNSFENHVLENAVGIPITLSAAPTTVGNQLSRHGQWGYFGTKIYIRLGASTYSVDLVLV